MSQARTLRQNQTTAEQKLWSRLRDRQLDGHKFKRQVPRGAYVVDFACLGEKLIVELDGGQHADSPHRERDRQRTTWLEGEGYRVLRFWNNEVLENIDGVLSVIAEALREPPHPDPLPGGERGKKKVPRPIGEREGPAKLGEGAAMLQARALRQNQTAAEQQLWSRLRNRQLEGYKFRRQVPLGPFIVDFCCYDEHLVVELDGSPHGDDQRRARDQERTLWLESRGFRVLRFWNFELLENMEGVLTRILQTLEKP